MVWVNLLPWRLEQRRKACQRWSVALILLALMLMAAGLPTLGQQTLNQRGEQGSRLRQALGHQLDKRLQQVTGLGKEREALRQQLTERQRRLKNLARWSSFVLDLTEMMPDTLWLSSVSKTANTLTLAGFCKGMEDLEAFRRHLQKTALAAQVKTGQLSRNAQDNMAFNLVITLKPEAEFDE